MKGLMQAFRPHFFFRQSGKHQRRLMGVQEVSFGPNSDW